MDPAEAAAREAIVAAGRRLDARGLVIGSSGNVSVRVGERVVCTPTGCSLAAMDPGGLSVVAMDGGLAAGPAPTSEIPLHLAVYRGTDAGAIVHVHAVASTAVSCTCDELAALHYNVVLLGGTPRTAAYARFGSEELAANVLDVLRTGRSAALMANHGSIAYGPTLDDAVERIEVLEWLCELHVAAHEVGSPRALSAAQVDEVRREYERRRATPG